MTREVETNKESPCFQVYTKISSHTASVLKDFRCYLLHLLWWMSCWVCHLWMMLGHLRPLRWTGYTITWCFYSPWMKICHFLTVGGYIWFLYFEANKIKIKVEIDVNKGKRRIYFSIIWFYYIFEEFTFFTVFSKYFSFLCHTRSIKNKIELFFILLFSFF